MRAVFCSLIALIIAISAAPAGAALCGDVPDVLIVLDRSGSMKESAGGSSKWSIAKTAVDNLTTQFKDQIAFGMMLFPRWPHVSNCTTGKVNVTPAATSGPAINSLLSGSYPAGDTPSTNTLQEARTWLKANKKSGVDQYVILITDGKETCSPHWPNTATGPLLSDGVKTYVIGFGSGVLPQPLTDAAIAGGTGQYYQADNLTQLNTALSQIAGAISCCGNGKIDAGEKCDTAIAAGQTGACPTTCNDGNTCTTDTVDGSDCNKACKYTPITQPKNNDGCCPPGATHANDNDCSSDCGNGKMDAGEKCDTGIAPGQAGACPTNCDDNNPCTKDQVFGSGCDAFCTHVNTCPTNLCGNGKIDGGEKCDTAIPKGQPGACPTHPSDCDDKDPNTQDFIAGTGCGAYCSHAGGGPAVCGNGKVEAGEWCDTGIPQGNPGACPQSCDDGQACTADKLMGSGCLAYCTNTPIKNAKDGDGCCPPGASATNDNDCPSGCGDGVLEPGEKCDPGIDASKPGACPKACDDDGDPCTETTLIGSGCDVRCETNSKQASAGGKDGCCPPGLTEAEDSDCLPPCTPDRTQNCVDPCQNVTCPDGQYCSFGKCVPWPGGNNGGETNGGAAGSAVEGGCDCRVDGESALPTALPLMLLVGLALLIRRRK
ncbi:MAG: hypothetical protein CSA24_02475 [Deltaproteobacteria bacterium]|nr:MAG: hypothetical protein CSA24_02475 [Deltaproteobacteria bacterium]